MPDPFHLKSNLVYEAIGLIGVDSSIAPKNPVEIVRILRAPHRRNWIIPAFLFSMGVFRSVEN